jgi:hypothetical protein
MKQAQVWDSGCVRAKLAAVPRHARGRRAAPRYGAGEQPPENFLSRQGLRILPGLVGRGKGLSSGTEPFSSGGGVHLIAEKQKWEQVARSGPP